MVISIGDGLLPQTLSHLEFESQPFRVVLKTTRIILSSPFLLGDVVFPKKNKIGECPVI